MPEDALEEIKAQLRARKKKVTKKGLSSGSTLLNLALTGNANWGFSNGSYYLLVGKSSSGKSWLSLTTLAEAANNVLYDDYRLIYDAPERGARMSMEKFFGRKMAERLEWKYSVTVEDFYYALDDVVQDGRPFIYVEDSESSLTSRDEGSKFQEQKLAYRKGKDVSGSYGDGKAKKHSTNLRRVIHDLERTKSILLLVSQSRDNIGFGAQFNPETRAGGRALTFYATAEMWFGLRGGIKKGVRGKQRKIGTILQVKVKKNRDTGREPTIELYHYPSHGLDDVGACVGYLVEEKYWKKGDKTIDAKDFEIKGSAEKIVEWIEENSKESELRDLVQNLWDEVDKECSVNRKKRYE